MSTIFDSFDPIMVEMGYTPKTTFWSDFTLAEHYGVAAIRDTYERSFRDWHGNLEYITELVLVLNHKIWQHHEHNDQLASIYNDLWKEADAWCMENLHGDDAEYYFETTD